MIVILMEQLGKKTLVLIDGKSVFYRGYYAMPHLSTQDGTPTGGVYGFATLAIELINRIKPDYVAVAWDKAGTNIRRRRKIYADYKANRHKAPEDFYLQIPLLKELLKALNWPLYEIDDYEADDIIGTLSKQASQQNIHTIMISSDLDMLQLVDHDVELYAMKRGLANLEKFDIKAFKSKYAIDVNQFLDLKSLKGDASDNIPGVPGVGEKTAQKLLKDFNNLDNIFANLASIKPDSLREKLEKGKQSAYMSKELATIWCDAPIKIDLDSMAIDHFDSVNLRKTLIKLEFNSLLKRLPKVMQITPTNSLGSNLDIDKSDSKIIKLDDQAKEKLAKAEAIFVAIIDDGLLLGLTKGSYYKVSYKLASQIISGRPVICYNHKDLARQFLAHNMAVNWLAEFDNKHASFMMNPLVKTLSLKDYILRQKTTVDNVDLMDATFDTYYDFKTKLELDKKLDHLARIVDFPLQLVLAKMEHRGVLVDKQVLTDLSVQLESDISKLKSRIIDLAGHDFNISSPDQLSEVLFNELSLPPTKKRNKRGFYSTGQKELNKLRHLHPIISLIEDYRALVKLKSTYTESLSKAIEPDGRIRTTFSQDITATGRLSSSNPNLQNIPTRTERGRLIKRAFTAKPGKVLISADYSQFELRLAAALASDKNLINLFNSDDIDIHTATAAEVYGVDMSAVSDDMRRHAKVINFGILYGMSPHGLADATGMDFQTAKHFIDDYFKLRAPIKHYLDSVLDQAKALGYVETLFGRKRPTPDIKSSNYLIREGAKRAAMNMPIQGTEADLMKMAMLKIEKEVGGANQIMQIHDSIVLECKPSLVEQVSDQIKSIMENIYPALGVKLKVEITSGSSWVDF